MYQVPGTDIIFACIMCALCMALAFIVGGLWSTSKVRVTLKQIKVYQIYALRQYAEKCSEVTSLIDALAQQQEHCDLMAELWASQAAAAVKRTKSELTKKHREAMKKYRAKCDRQVVHHMETYTANQQVQLSGLAMPDFSALLSK